MISPFNFQLQFAHRIQSDLHATQSKFSSIVKWMDETQDARLGELHLGCSAQQIENVFDSLHFKRHRARLKIPENNIYGKYVVTAHPKKIVNENCRWALRWTQKNKNRKYKKWGRSHISRLELPRKSKNGEKTLYLRDCHAISPWTRTSNSDVWKSYFEPMEVIVIDSK